MWYVPLCLQSPKERRRRRGKDEEKEKRNEGRKEKNTNTSLVAWGLSVESVTYSIHTVQVDNNNNFKAALFSFSFEQGLLGMEEDRREREWEKSRAGTVTRGEHYIYFSSLFCSF